MDKHALKAIALATSLLVLAGCATQTSQPPVQSKVEQPAPVTPPTTTAPLAPKPTSDRLKEASARPPAPFVGTGWQALFDGSTLNGWHETAFAGHGRVECESGLVVLNMGDPFTGINWTNEFPNMNFEVALDAMRVMGADFFCGLTVPVGDSFCSLIVGGWGGALVGISSLNGMDASENETAKYVNFEQDRWYRIRLRVTEKRIEAWIDDKKLVDVDTTDRKISLRPGDIELSKPFGLAAWQTTAALRELRMRRVDGPAGKSADN